MAMDSTLRGEIEKDINTWVSDPEINLDYIRSLHPSGNPNHNYIFGFIHGNITQYCWCVMADYYQRKPKLNEKLEASALVRRRITEIDDAITRAEEFETAEDEAFDEDMDDEDK